MGRARTHIHRLLLAGLAAVSCWSACAGPPVQEMSDARQAIEAAEDAGALEHAPMQLRFARDLISSAETKLSKSAPTTAPGGTPVSRVKKPSRPST